MSNYYRCWWCRQKRWGGSLLLLGARSTVSLEETLFVLFGWVQHILSNNNIQIFWVVVVVVLLAFGLRAETTFSQQLSHVLSLLFYNGTLETKTVEFTYNNLHTYGQPCFIAYSKLKNQLMNNWSRNPSRFYIIVRVQRPVSIFPNKNIVTEKTYTNWPTLHLIHLFVFKQITCAGKCSVRQGVQSVALELHICEFRLRMSDTLAVVSPSAEISLLDGDTVLLEDATRVRDERGGMLYLEKTL